MKLIPFKWARHQLDSILFFVYARASSLATMKFGKTFLVQQNMTKPMIKFETAAARMEALQLEVSSLNFKQIGTIFRSSRILKRMMLLGRWHNLTSLMH